MAIESSIFSALVLSGIMGLSLGNRVGTLQDSDLVHDTIGKHLNIDSLKEMHLKKLKKAEENLAKAKLDLEELRKTSAKQLDELQKAQKANKLSPLEYNKRIKDLARVEKKIDLLTPKSSTSNIFDGIIEYDDGTATIKLHEIPFGDIKDIAKGLYNDPDLRDKLHKFDKKNIDSLRVGDVKKDMNDVLEKLSKRLQEKGWMKEGENLKEKDLQKVFKLKPYDNDSKKKWEEILRKREQMLKENSTEIL